MSKLDPRRCLLRGFRKGLFDFRKKFERIFRRNLITWPVSEAPPAAL